MRLALDLGLRSIEISRLGLDDVDWRLGSVTLKRTKSRRQDVLPLSPVTGQALAAYILEERPQTSNRALFVRHLAPYDQPIGVDAIRRVVRDAFRRVGIPHGRTHALRHYPESRNIPSQIGGARAGGAFRSIVEGWLSAYCMRSESIEKREKLVIRSKASDSSRLWLHLIQGGLLHLEIGVEIYLRRLD